MADGDLISRESLLAGIAELKKSPWYNYGNYEGDFYDMTGQNMIDLLRYSARKEAVENIIDVCIKKEPAVLADSGWISVEERLPEEDRTIHSYFVAIGDWVGIMAFYGGKFREDLFGKEPDFPVHHWMPLPEPPKGE